MDQKGRILGRRDLDGYTLSLRKGPGVSADQPLYVVRKDPVQGTVVLRADRTLYTGALTAGNVNLISMESLPNSLQVTAKPRYSQLGRRPF